MSERMSDSCEGVPAARWDSLPCKRVAVASCSHKYLCHLTTVCTHTRLRATAGGGGPRNIDSFLGVLYLVQDYKVYGYVTNTGVRFVLVVDDKDNKDGRYHLSPCPLSSLQLVA